jgi:hypothetical protein
LPINNGHFAVRFVIRKDESAAVVVNLESFDLLKNRVKVALFDARFASVRSFVDAINRQPRVRASSTTTHSLSRATLIHAGKFRRRDDADRWARRRSLWVPEEPLPRGVILGCVELVDCIENSDSPWALRGSYHWLLRSPSLLNRDRSHTKEPSASRGARHHKASVITPAVPRAALAESGSSRLTLLYAITSSRPSPHDPKQVKESHFRPKSWRLYSLARNPRTCIEPRSTNRERASRSPNDGETLDSQSRPSLRPPPTMAGRRLAGAGCGRWPRVADEHAALVDLEAAGGVERLAEPGSRAVHPDLGRGQ